MQPALQSVKHQAAASRVRTHDLPPLLFERLNRLTRGRALRAYAASLEANARLGAQIAAALASR